MYKQNDLNDLQEPTVGRALYAGGFVFGDSFDDFLKNISEDYLRAAWEHLSAVLEQNAIVAEDLSWGWMHPGETGFPGEDSLRSLSTALAPNSFIGWTSRDLSEIWRTGEDSRIDELLKYDKPVLRCTATWRSLKWRIAPDDFALALRLIAAICTDEISDWHPSVVLQSVVEPLGLWQQAAEAIRDGNQQELDSILEQARREYTALGYRILVGGYSAYIRGGTDYIGGLALPEVMPLLTDSG